jgi:ketoreductase RED1
VPLLTPSPFTKQLARFRAFFARKSRIVANRLQRAIFRECCHLVLEGVVTVDELDDIVTSSIGLRWVADGPLPFVSSWRRARGFVSFFRQFAPEWKQRGKPGRRDAGREITANHIDQRKRRSLLRLRSELNVMPTAFAILKALASVKAGG